MRKDRPSWRRRFGLYLPRWEEYAKRDRVGAADRRPHGSTSTVASGGGSIPQPLRRHRPSAERGTLVPCLDDASRPRTRRKRRPPRKLRRYAGESGPYGPPFTQGRGRGTGANRGPRLCRRGEVSTTRLVSPRHQPGFLYPFPYQYLSISARHQQSLLAAVIPILLNRVRPLLFQIVSQGRGAGQAQFTQGRRSGQRRGTEPERARDTGARRMAPADFSKSKHP
jgi:hypothetical protein